MVKVKKDDKILKVDSEVAEVLVERHGYTIEELTETEMIKEKLDELGIEYHTQLGLPKLKALLEKSLEE